MRCGALVGLGVVLVACGSEATLDDAGATVTTSDGSASAAAATSTTVLAGATVPTDRDDSSPASASATSTVTAADTDSSTDTSTVTSTDTSTGVATTTPEVTATLEASVDDPGPAPGCRRVDDFDTDDARWFVVNDGVMGGRSEGRITIEDSVLRFDGTIVTAGGGFTSVRLRLDGDELAGSTRIDLRVRADGRGYGMTYEDDEAIQGRSVSHVAGFAEASPADDDGFQTVSLGHDALAPSIFGRLVDAPPFDPDAAREIGIIIADGIDGDFVLDVDWIDACA